MLSESSLKFLEEFMNASSPSGFEEEAAAVFRNYLKPCCDEVRTDVLGNTMAVLNPSAPMKVMLAGHYDEIGFQVVYISDEGLLYIRPNGGIDKLNVPSTEVEILTEKGRVHGVIGKKPIHLLKPAERDTPPELSDMWIDIGAENKAEAEKLVSIGDPVAVKSNFRRLNENRFMSKGMDDKVGAFIVAETMRRLSERKLNVAVYGVGTVQEEVGLRGAHTSCFGVDPQVGFCSSAGSGRISSRRPAASSSAGEKTARCRSTASAASRKASATPGSLPRWTPKPASAPISPGNSPPKRMEQYVIAAAPRTLLWNWMSYSARMRQVFCGHRRP